MEEKYYVKRFLFGKKLYDEYNKIYETKKKFNNAKFNDEN